MRTFLKIAFITILVVFAAIQVRRPARANPPVNPARRIQATAQVPPQVNAILKRACSDCHSNETRWPWYTNVAPLSWWIVDHVNEGREHLNFSEWASYSTEDAAHLLDEICQEVKQGKMPLENYVYLHPDARLSQADVNTLCAWKPTFVAKPVVVEGPPEKTDTSRRKAHDHSKHAH